MSQRTISSFFKPKSEKSVNGEETPKVKIEPMKNETPQKSQKRSLANEKSNGSPKVEESTPKRQKVEEKEPPPPSPKQESPEVAAPSALESKDEPLKDVKPEVAEQSATPAKPVTFLSLNSAKTDEKEINEFDPSSAHYHPEKDAYWAKGVPTPYLALARTFELIESTKGRLKMIDILSNFFCSVMVLNPADLLPSVYLCVNQVAPAYEGVELGVAEATLKKAICTDKKVINKWMDQLGDLGLVAEKIKVTQRTMRRPQPLTVAGVYQKLKNIAKAPGGSKLTVIQDVFTACRLSESRYFIRSLLGKLRLGIAELSLVSALANALVKRNRYAECKPHRIVERYKPEIDETLQALKTVFCQCPNYELVVPALLEHDVNRLAEICPMRPGMPLKPMLAQPSKGVTELFERFPNMAITCEYKYDGERAQIHRDDEGHMSIYSRNQENNTLKYPDLTARSQKLIKGDGDAVSSYILDSEIVAWDVERSQILPFQVLSTRKRKNVDEAEIRVQVCVYIFDLLYLNGESLVTKPLGERRRLLHENFQAVDGEWQFATHLDTTDMDKVQEFLDESIQNNCEGLMVKTLAEEATYEIAKRSHNWLKLKKDYLDNVGDSLDLVVIGGYKGKGKRTGAYGGFLLACYDVDNEEYQSICKIGTGFSDEDLRAHAEFLKAHVITSPRSYYRYDTSLEPDDWFEPVQVWEVKCADLSLSPIHRAGIGIVDSERGISLRFPRFIRIRDDKSPEQATDAQQVATMYNSQAQIKNANDVSASIDSEFY